jgi:hypothetical protein
MEAAGLGQEDIRFLIQENDLFDPLYFTISGSILYKGIKFAENDGSFERMGK